MIYDDEGASFEDILLRDKSFSIHERNIRSLEIKLYKVAYGFSPRIIFFLHDIPFIDILLIMIKRKYILGRVVFMLC